MTGLENLPRLRYVNRQRGADTRVLPDHELARRGMALLDDEDFHAQVEALGGYSVADTGRRVA